MYLSALPLLENLQLLFGVFDPVRVLGAVECRMKVKENVLQVQTGVEVRVRIMF